VAVGLCADGKVKLNPPMETVIGEKDQIILLEKDDGDFDMHPARKVDESKLSAATEATAQHADHLLVLGSNDKLPIILAEYSRYVQPGTRVTIVDDDLDEEKLGAYENLDISVYQSTISRQKLCELLSETENNVLLMNDDSLESEASDAQTLLRLILLRDVADKQNREFAITTEMRSADNQRLASQARVDDFVIGSNFVSLLLAQISENANMAPLITDLLDETGSELYMKPASDYVPLGQPVDSYILTESAARKGEIYIGYRKYRCDVVVNPNKTDILEFDEKDMIVVIAED
jgi:hypothetical protein